MELAYSSTSIDKISFLGVLLPKKKHIIKREKYTFHSPSYHLTSTLPFGVCPRKASLHLLMELAYSSTSIDKISFLGVLLPKKKHIIKREKYTFHSPSYHLTSTLPFGVCPRKASLHLLMESAYSSTSIDKISLLGVLLQRRNT